MADIQKELQKIALIFRALGDSNRLKILSYILSSPMGSLTVSEIVEGVALSQPLVSHHLKELKYAGILISKRRGPFIHYMEARDNTASNILHVAGLLSNRQPDDSSDTKKMEIRGGN